MSHFFDFYELGLQITRLNFVKKSEKFALIDQAFASLDENLRNFLKLLVEKHLISDFSRIAAKYYSLYNEVRGIENVEVITAVPISDEAASKIKEKLSRKIGKKIIIKNTVNPEIIGGVKLRYSGIQLDSSIKTKIKKFEESLKKTVV